MSAREERFGGPEGTFGEVRPGLRGFVRLSDRLFPSIPSTRSVILALAAFVVTGCVASVVYLAVVTPTYSASMVIGPTQEQFSSSPSNQLERSAMSLLSGGGLLSGPRVITPYDAFLQTFQSREVADHLFADPAVRKELFPGAWDATTKSWNVPFNIKSELTAPLYWITGRSRPTAPTADTIEQILKARLDLSMIERGPMYTVSFSDRNRAHAMDFLSRAFRITDAIVKEKNREQVLQRIHVLKSRMNDLDVVDYRSQFTTLLMDQEKQLLVLQGGTDFAASIVVSPNAPDYPDSPRLFVTVVMFATLFVLLGASILAFVYREEIRRRLVGKFAAKDRDDIP